MDDQCVTKSAVTAIMDLRKDFNPDVVMGPGCSSSNPFYYLNLGMVPSVPDEKKDIKDHVY